MREAALDADDVRSADGDAADALATDEDATLATDEDAAPVVRSGADVVSIARIADLLDEFGDSFAERAFAPEEREYCDARSSPPQHYAARWAAKEAFLKVLDEPSPTVPLDEIAIERAPTGPRLDLGVDAAAALAEALASAGADPGRFGASVSLSHDRDRGVATAHVVVVGAAASGGERGGDGA